jgi:peptide/nickel transport system substrate-binding protein
MHMRIDALASAPAASNMAPRCPQNPFLMQPRFAFFSRRRFAGLSLALVLAISVSVAHAKTLRWASQGDVLTFDPHAFNGGVSNAFASYVYDGLVHYDVDFNIEPGLAMQWTQPDANTWRFTLRPGVRFHDGTPFNADDVVFSIERALAPTSGFKVYLAGVSGARRVDDLTVELSLTGPNPVLLRQLTGVRIVSKVWAIKNKVEKPQNFAQKEETFAVRNANGTGPFILKATQADAKTVLVRNPNWWGTLRGNVTEIVYTPIASDATRLAALLSGELDFVLDPAPNDVARLRNTAGVKVIEGPEFRTLFLGLDQSRDELQYSSVKGRNPFKDLRVRQALYQAIDIDAIRRAVMRGLSQPAGSYVAPQVSGYTAEGDRRLGFDPIRAKALLAEAGYPQGFDVSFDCPNNRYINDEEICKSITSYLAKVGITARLNALPGATYFPKIARNDTSLYLFGWGVPTFDALYTLQSLVRTPGQGADGNWNYGRYSNPAVDALIDRIKVEADPAKRQQTVLQALKTAQDDVALIPLHHQVTPWLARANVSVVHRANNALDIRYVQID